MMKEKQLCLDADLLICNSGVVWLWTVFSVLWMGSRYGINYSSPISRYAGDDKHLHHCVAAFISDVTPVGTPIGAHAARGFK